MGQILLTVGKFVNGHSSKMVFPSVQILSEVTRARLGDDLKSYNLILTQKFCTNKQHPNEPMTMIFHQKQNSESFDEN